MRTINPKSQFNAAKDYLGQNVWIVSLLGMISALAFYYAQVSGLGHWIAPTGITNSESFAGPTFHELRQGAMWSLLPSYLLPYLCLGTGLTLVYGLMRWLWSTHPVHHHDNLHENNETRSVDSIFDYDAIMSFLLGIGVYAAAALFSMFLIAPFLDRYIREISSNFSPVFETSVRSGAVSITEQFMRIFKTFVVVTVPLYLGTQTILRRWNYRRENMLQTIKGAFSVKQNLKSVLIGSFVISTAYHLLLKPGTLLQNPDVDLSTGHPVHLAFWFFAIVTQVAMLDSYCRRFRRVTRSGHTSHHVSNSSGTVAGNGPSITANTANARFVAEPQIVNAKIKIVPNSDNTKTK